MESSMPDSVLTRLGCIAHSLLFFYKAMLRNIIIINMSVLPFHPLIRDAFLCISPRPTTRYSIFKRSTDIGDMVDPGRCSSPPLVHNICKTTYSYHSMGDGNSGSCFGWASRESIIHHKMIGRLDFIVGAVNLGIFLPSRLFLTAWS